MRKYQKGFIKRVGDLVSACQLLRDSPHRDVLKLLANTDTKQNPKLPGWVLKQPKRRALRQAELWTAFGRALAEHSHSSSDEGENLPEEVKYLLDRELLERGFQITCSLCSAQEWYRAEEVGQSFSCHRCYENQKLRSNPTWLYKLPEVVYQLLNSNADVPLLALSVMAARSEKQFCYVLDFDIFQASDPRGQNIDFACFSDGLAYIGEAKTVDYIYSVFSA